MLAEAELDEDALRAWNAAFPDRSRAVVPKIISHCIIGLTNRRASSSLFWLPGAAAGASLGCDPDRAHCDRQAQEC